MYNDEEANRRHETRLARWHKSYEHLLHSDRVAMDLGLFTLKVAMTINAGALIALLAAMDILKGAPGAEQFFLGLMAASLAGLLAFFGNGLGTLALAGEFEDQYSEQRTTPRYLGSKRPGTVLKLIAVALAPLAYGMFAWGGCSVLARIDTIHSVVG